MHAIYQTGRDKEIAEIVRAKRAAEVGRLLLGELDQLSPIFESNFDEWTRPRLKQERDLIRTRLQGEITKFCKENFEGLTESRLADLYEPLWENGGIWRLPLIDFQSRYGIPKKGVLLGAPLHSTVCISPWGLQTEFPELHLSKDLSEAVNTLLELQEEFDAIEAKKLSWNDAKKQRQLLARLQRRINYNARMSLIAIFNLIEAYLNGLAWEYLSANDSSKLTKKNREILSDSSRNVSLNSKIKKYPRIIKGCSEGPLHDSREPLKSFVDEIRPIRDSIVHASPFSAPENFGGRDKLNSIYSLDAKTALEGVSVGLDVIQSIHEFLDDSGEMPSWMPTRDGSGRFLVDSPH